MIAKGRATLETTIIIIIRIIIHIEINNENNFVHFSNRHRFLLRLESLEIKHIYDHNSQGVQEPSRERFFKESKMVSRLFPPSNNSQKLPCNSFIFNSELILGKRQSASWSILRHWPFGIRVKRGLRIPEDQEEILSPFPNKNHR